MFGAEKILVLRVQANELPRISGAYSWIGGKREIDTSTQHLSAPQVCCRCISSSIFHPR
jgi:hypothetical protein